MVVYTVHTRKVVVAGSTVIKKMEQCPARTYVSNQNSPERAQKLETIITYSEKLGLSIYTSKKPEWSSQMIKDFNTNTVSRYSSEETSLMLL